MIYPQGLKCLPQLVRPQTALAQRIIRILCLGQVTFSTCTNYFTPGETIFHGKDFYSQVLEIIWTKKTNSVAQNMNEPGLGSNS